jgi:DNA gyrase subunit A
MTLRKNARVLSCEPFEEGKLAASHRYRTRTLPGSGSLPRPEDLGEQLKL